MANKNIVDRLRFLVSLDNPEHGGPYGGTAARECMEAMTEAADEIVLLRSKVEDLQVARIVAENPGIDEGEVRESLRRTNG